MDALAGTETLEEIIGSFETAHRPRRKLKVTATPPVNRPNAATCSSLSRSSCDDPLLHTIALSNGRRIAS
jgi:hypothetical protein